MNRIEVLSARLMRIACDFDALVQALAEERLVSADMLLFAAPAHHIEIARNTLAQTLFEVEQHGRNYPWPETLANELEDAA